jgi:F-type H+-transporting ATPase subunit b
MPGVVPTCLISLGAAGEAAPATDGIMAIEPQMVILTWIAFLLVVWILHRTTWKPILNALESRENRIRRALDDAAKAEKNTADLQSQHAVLIEQSRAESRKMIEAARQVALESARQIEERAQAQARSLAEETRRELETAVGKAREALRRDTADLALALAERVIGESMDSSRDRILIEKQIKITGS